MWSLIVKLGSIVFMLVCLMACSMWGCRPNKDVAIAPAELNHNRAVFKVNGQTTVGMAGITKESDAVEVHPFAFGRIEVRGLGNCGTYSGFDAKSYTFVKLSTAGLMEHDLCIYNVEVSPTLFDAPAIGKLVFRKFSDPSVLPLALKANGVLRAGINWVQLHEGELVNSNATDFGTPEDNVLESRDLVFYQSGKSGKMIITGCGAQLVYDYGNNPFSITVDTLYRTVGALSQDCVFTITANNDDYLKESATLLVGVYKDIGGYISRPTVYTKNGLTCFEFGDKNVIAVTVNNLRTSGWNDRTLCAKEAASYEVLAVTSKARTFYGKYANGAWVEVQ